LARRLEAVGIAPRDLFVVINEPMLENWSVRDGVPVVGARCTCTGSRDPSCRWRRLWPRAWRRDRARCTRATGAAKPRGAGVGRVGPSALVRGVGGRCSCGGCCQQASQERILFAHGLVGDEGDLTVSPFGDFGTCTCTCPHRALRARPRLVR
jgi:hypothetical protein